MHDLAGRRTASSGCLTTNYPEVALGRGMGAL